MTSEFSGKKVLITGAGGFIGSHLTERLVTAGAQTRALVHYNAFGNWGWLDNSPLKQEVQVIAGDICDRDCVKEAIKDCEVVFHLAALIAIPYSYRAPGSYVRTNVEGTLNVLQACREVGVVRLVHTSTSEVYGTARYVPIDEKHPLQGQSPYSASKIGADKIAEAFHLSFNVPVVTVRPFNTFGPRQSARAVIPTIITQCLSGEIIRLGSLNPTRDLNYVSNTVDGYLSAACSPNAIGKTVNLGTGREISIGDLAKLISEILGCRVAIETENARMRPEKSEVERLLADNSLAKQVLGWTPKVNLEQGLSLTVDWIRRNMNNYRSGVYVI
jgi:NAD dependent epimerase/dehydratase